MFSLRKSFSGINHWNREFVEKFLEDLTIAGFDNINIKLPHNLVKIGKSEISKQDFLERERNYPSLIIFAVNTNNKETLKLLVVNISKQTFFLDDTFPSGLSEPTELYVQSPDPARTYSLLNFFYDYLNTKGSKEIRTRGTLGLLIIGFQVIFYLSNGKGIINNLSNYESAIYLDPIMFYFGILWYYQLLATPSGLYIKSRENSLLKFSRKVMTGELKDNPLVNILIAIITTILTSVILKMLELI